MMWTKAGGRTVQGLVNRRRDEVKICLTGLG
jgi:GH24 family phage-related lysozyme (muramidase)